MRPSFSDDFEYHFFLTPDNSYTPLAVDSNQIAINASRPVSRPQPFTLLTYPDGQEYGFTAATSLSVAPGSLLDYLGMLPVGFNNLQWSTSRRLDALPFIGYYDIFRNYYANPHDPYVPFRCRNFSSDVLVGTKDYTVDRFVSINCFDNFISSIVVSSISGSSPTAVDALSQFYSNFIFTDTPTLMAGDQRYAHPPMFAGETVFTGLNGTISKTQLLYDTRDGRHFGLLRRTYMDDYFNSRFMNSFVTYMEEQSRVRVQDNQFNITQLRTANRIAKYVDKSIFSDTRFGSWIKAHFGVKTNQNLCIPQFLCSITSNIIFNDIYSSAQTGRGDITDNEALGSRASLGQGYIQNKGAFVEFQATEPGVLMCLFSIVPYVSYFQGIKKMYLKTSFSDMYKPEFDAIGYDDLQKLELSAVPNYIQDYGVTDGITPLSIQEYNTSVGKHPAWMEYMTSTDEAHGLMAQKYQYGYWLLNRPFSPYAYDPTYHYDDETDTFPGATIVLNQGTRDISEISTYILPEYFNTIFAVDKFTDNFQVQIRWYDRTKQPISKQILPHL